jgi:hypothetical protein
LRFVSTFNLPIVHSVAYAFCSLLVDLLGDMAQLLAWGWVVLARKGLATLRQCVGARVCRGDVGKEKSEKRKPKQGV